MFTQSGFFRRKKRQKSSLYRFPNSVASINGIEYN
jgi:hypothetical protein